MNKIIFILIIHLSITLNAQPDTLREGNRFISESRVVPRFGIPLLAGVEYFHFMPSIGSLKSSFLSVSAETTFFILNSASIGFGLFIIDQQLALGLRGMWVHNFQLGFTEIIESFNQFGYAPTLEWFRDRFNLRFGLFISPYTVAPGISFAYMFKKQ